LTGLRSSRGLWAPPQCRTPAISLPCQSKRPSTVLSSSSENQRFTQSPPSPKLESQELMKLSQSKRRAPWTQIPPKGARSRVS
jgi:hypothetical protein